ncbi:MAG: DivIVA domain-containing protein [Ilumatobacteraceae bacterium]
MALSPQRVRDTNFKSAKRGYDQADVNAFVEEVATALETAQNEATAMEARARAAVARLQELSQQAPAEAEDAAPTIRASVDESETISRTMLLAQRTADATVAEAQAEADRVLNTARDEATAHLDSARQEAIRVIEEAKVEARRAGESERVRVEGEVQALLARRDFLESDVDHLQQHLVAQRERIVEAVASLTDLVNRVPDGLADMRRPLLSAAADPVTPEASDADATADVAVELDDEDEDPFDVEVPSEEERSEIAEITRVAEAAPSAGSGDPTSAGTTSLFAEDGEPTEQFDVIRRDR